MSKISLKHTDGNVVSLNSPTNAPDQADVAFKLPNADGSAGQALVTDGSGNLSFSNVAGGSAKNLIINGAMLVAQRGTSSTSTGYASVDRFNLYHANTGVTITQSQQSSASSDTPYTLGFRNFFRMALASAGTANANAEIGLTTHLEAQDVANSGWNLTSSTSNITLSFWFRCSTNQTFYAYLRSRDGTNYNYPFSFTASGNNAWTKITKTIPGNSNLQIDNDNERGLSISIIPFYGTDLTNNLSLDQWSAYDTANRMPDMASTWLTAGASTFDITGLQLEVGSTASDFEHRTFAQELHLCNRYYYDVLGPSPETDFGFAVGGKYNGTFNFCVVNFPVQMRRVPTLESSTTTDSFYKIVGSNVDNYADHAMSKGGRTGARIYPNTGNDDVGSNGDAVILHANNPSACQLRFNAEL